MAETQCNYVSSHGIMKSCKLSVTSLNQPNLAWDLVRLKERDTLYVNGDILRSFYESFWKFIKYPVILITGNKDESYPETWSAEPLLAESNLIHWFGQNMLIEHPKCSPIPIGLDYHTLFAHIGMQHPWGAGSIPITQESILCHIRNLKKNWDERHPIAYCNWHFFADRGERREVLSNVAPELLFKSQQYLPRIQTWFDQTQFAFVASPTGAGHDCHRTWEALILGCVPIIKSSKCDKLYEGLPVWIIKDWSEITAAKLLEKRAEYGSKDAQQLFESERLSLEYWMKRIRSA